MIKCDLIQKQAEPSNVHLVDLVLPLQRGRVAENFCKRQRTIPLGERGCPVQFRVRISIEILSEIQVMPPTWRYDRTDGTKRLERFPGRNIQLRRRVNKKTASGKP